MHDDWVVLETFSDVLQAQVVKAKLETERIESRLADENILSVNPLYTSAIGGVKLKVRARDVARAKEALDDVAPPLQVVSESMEDQASPAVQEYLRKSKRGRKCPKCGTNDIVFEWPSRWASLFSWVLLNLPFYSMKRKWTCSSCGNHWQG